MRIISNKAKCNICNEIIESVESNYPIWCKCKNIAVNGGTCLIVRLGKNGKPENYTDMSEIEGE